MIPLKKGYVIAIDGPAGTGKSSTTKALAQRLQFVHIDSGALYRSVAWAALQKGIISEKDNELSDSQMKKLEDLTVSAKIEFKNQPELMPSNRVWVNGQDVTKEIRSPEVTHWSSKVSAVPGVRQALVGLQKSLGSASSSILEGRDIGTVIFPDADIKFFLIASVDERARRRLLELGGAGDLSEVRQSIIERDKRDSERELAPMKKAHDAIEIDTSSLTMEEVLKKMESMIRDKLSSGNKGRKPN